MHKDHGLDEDPTLWLSICKAVMGAQKYYGNNEGI